MTKEIRSAQIPAPQDRPYPGTLELQVDASDTRQGIFRVHQTIPVQPGPLFLLYPKWIPGHHSPTGPIDKFAGLTIRANGKPLAWQREKYDVHAFRVDVPAGVSAIDVDFQYLSPRSRGQGPTEMTDVLLNLVWSKTSLYPAGHFARQIMVEASVKLPQGWEYGTALREASRAGGAITFETVPYNVLID
jgi:predicted metalloprotease with PDZ domain